MSNAQTDRFLQVSRWYRIGIPLLLLALFGFSFFGVNGFDRPSFELLQERWGGVIVYGDECTEYGYLTGPTMDGGQLPRGYLRQEYQDQVAIMQYVLAPIVVRESISAPCLLADVGQDDTKRVYDFATARGYRVEKQFGNGRFLLLQNSP